VKLKGDDDDVSEKVWSLISAVMLTYIASVKFLESLLEHVHGLLLSRKLRVSIRLTKLRNWLISEVISDLILFRLVYFGFVG